MVVSNDQEIALEFGRSTNRCHGRPAAGDCRPGQEVRSIPQRGLCHHRAAQEIWRMTNPWMSDIHVVILAAGQGTRMKSVLPKVLHPIAGRPMIDHVLDAAASISPATVTLIVGHQAEAVRSRLAGRQGVSFVLQEPQLGTAHALQQAEPLLASRTGTVVLLSGDVPLLRPVTLQRLLEDPPRRTGGRDSGDRRRRTAVRLRPDRQDSGHDCPYRRGTRRVAGRAARFAKSTVVFTHSTSHRFSMHCGPLPPRMPRVSTT